MSEELGKLTLRVTLENIRTAERGNPQHCMIGKAIRANPAYTSVAIKDGHVKFNYKDWRYCYQLSAAAMAKVADFDEGKEIKPFRFTLQSPYRRKVQRRGPMGPNKNKTRKRKPSEAKFCKRRYRGSSSISKKGG